MTCIETEFKDIQFNDFRQPKLLLTKKRKAPVPALGTLNTEYAKEQNVRHSMKKTFICLERLTKIIKAIFTM